MTENVNNATKISCHQYEKLQVCWIAGISRSWQIPAINAAMMADVFRVKDVEMIYNRGTFLDVTS